MNIRHMAILANENENDEVVDDQDIFKKSKNNCSEVEREANNKASLSDG